MTYDDTIILNALQCSRFEPRVILAVLSQGVEITAEMMSGNPSANATKTLVTQVGRDHDETINVFITGTYSSIAGYI